MRNARVRNHNGQKPKIRRGVFKSITELVSRNKVGEILVLRGIISPYDLKNALKNQHETQKPLGQILVELGLISKHRLTAILFKQKILRVTAAAFIYLASFSSFIKTSQASDFKELPAKIILASADQQDFSKMHTYPKLFGAQEKKSKNLKAFTKWVNMFERFDLELNGPSAQKLVHYFKTELHQYQSDSIYEMAQDINHVMNQKKYIVDQKNWGKSDYWATPLEFIARGGDCEDFAIAKYVALSALGVPEDRLRIAIVQDQIKKMPHAILIVYSERGPYVLDNQIKNIRSSKSIDHYKPIFSINRSAWWLHTVPGKSSNTIVASAK